MGQVGQKEKALARKDVPKSLVYEILDGRPIYYKGYKEVLAGNKTLEDIMGSSALQAEIVTYLLRLLFAGIDLSKFRVLTNEIGSHLDKRNNLSNDIAVYDKKILTGDMIDVHYPNVPAELVIEVDVDADMEEGSDNEYIQIKTQKMLEFGVKKVIWITTKTRKVMSATLNEDWLVMDWNKDIEVMEGIRFNIAAYLEEEGIVLTDED